MRNLRFAWRSLTRNPGFAVAAILSLAIGIGANTAIFTLSDQILWRMLPVKEPQRLVMMKWQGTFIGGTSRGLNDTFSYPTYTDLRDARPPGLSNIAASYQDMADIADHGPAEHAVVELVSGNYFDTLGATAHLGRTFSADDDRPGLSQPVVVLSHAYWMRRFGGNPAVLNRTVEVNGAAATVVGVARNGFKGIRLINPPDVFAPLAMKTIVTPTWDDMKRRNSIWLKVISRLADGADLKSAQASIQSAFHASAENDLASVKRNADFERRYRNNWLKLEPAAQGFTRSNEVFLKPAEVLLIMVGTLLMLACVNVANLLITRSAGRRKEIAIRLSIGATRWQLVRLMMTESLLVAFAGGALGIIISEWMAAFLVRQIPGDQLAVAINTTPDARVLAFSLLLTLATPLVFGLVPALQSSRTDLAPVLKSEASSSSAARSQTRLRTLLVTAQVTLSFVLLTSAGLFARSLYNLFTVNTGMDISSLLTFSVDPSLHKYTPERMRDFYQRVQSGLAQAPGVLSVSGASSALLTGGSWENTVNVEGYRPTEDEDMQAKWNSVLPGFFSTLGAPLIAGRDFRESDAGSKVRSVIVNEAFVKRFFKDGVALGRHVGFGSPPRIEIVGVVKDMQAESLNTPVRPWTWTAALEDSEPGPLTFYVRTRGNPLTAAQSARDVVKRIDASLPVFDLKTVEAQAGETHFTSRLLAMLAAAFGLVATLLASVGLFGVTAYSVVRRTREIGIRIALGAERRIVLKLVLREVALVAATGLAAGVPLALGLGRLIQSQLFGVKGSDPWTMSIAMASIASACLLAGYLPARRAARIDPLRALRYE
ncbi:MAG: ABC transporter permease [Acidobacteria bacterium]|nr:ABC transporter permease [Acidobacteriota bacterium]